MADTSCSPSDFSGGRSCDSGVLWPSDTELDSAVVGVLGSWVSVSADTSASLDFPDNLREYFSLDLQAFQPSTKDSDSEFLNSARLNDIYILENWTKPA